MGVRIPYESAKEARFRQRIERSRKAQEESETRISEQITNRIAMAALHEEDRRQGERMSFEMYLTAIDIQSRLEDMRDENTPKTPDEQWNEAFCTAIEKLPEARMYVEDCAMDCIGRKDNA